MMNKRIMCLIRDDRLCSRPQHIIIVHGNVWNAVTVLCGQLDCDHGTL